MLCGLLVISVPLTQNLWLLDWALEIIENGRDVLCVWRNMFQYLQTLSGHLQTCEYGHMNNMQSTNAFSVECNSQCAGDMQVLCTNGNCFHCSWKHNTKKCIIFLSEVRIKQFGHICYFFPLFCMMTYLFVLILMTFKFCRNSGVLQLGLRSTCMTRHQGRLPGGASRN